MRDNAIVSHGMPRFQGSLQEPMHQVPGATQLVQLAQADRFGSEPDCRCSVLTQPALFAVLRQRCEQWRARREASAAIGGRGEDGAPPPPGQPKPLRPARPCRSC